MHNVNCKSSTPIPPSGSSVAVIGSGIAGLGAAWLLHRNYRITLFEQADYFGGHTHTVNVAGRKGPLPVDTGFIVYNTHNYPHLCALFASLGVATQASDMSFAASIDDGRIEYCGDSLNTLYAQRRHLISPRFQRMLWDLLRFNRLAKRLLKVAGAAPQAVSSGLHWPEEDTLAPPRVETLGEFLARERFSSAFRDHYLLPMAAAIWSCPCQTMLEFPALSLMRFFYNHGLLEITNRPAWRTVTGGSRCYVEKILTALGEAARLQAKAVKIVRRPQGVTVVLEKGGQEQFDQVVIATHADEALTLLADPEPLERRLLSAFRYQQNRALLHTDPVLMPKRRRLWASWNYLARQGSDAAHFIPGVSVTYWMNRLQDLADDTDYFVSLNPLQEPAPGRVIKEVSYAHPVFDEQAMAAQRYLSKIQGQGKVWFAGSYFGYGFHEDGLRSAMAVAAALGVAAPWQEPRRNLPEREANPRRAVADPTADVIVPFLS